MNDLERYTFDRQGYLHIPGLLAKQEASAMYEACLALERDALEIMDRSPRWKDITGWHGASPYWQSERWGYFANGEKGQGKALMVEDFWLFRGDFDFLIGHEPTMKYIRRVVQGGITINNSEFRLRYPGNRTGIHMGFPQGHAPKYRYAVSNGEINCMMVRMIYFFHDVDPNDGVTCFVPGSHKSAFDHGVQCKSVDDEPGAIGVPCKAGDAILFTEACRHGGFVNRGPRPRYTLHVGCGPSFLKSQNVATMEEEPNVTEALLSRLSDEQRKLLVTPRRTRSNLTSLPLDFGTPLPRFQCWKQSTI